MSARLHPYLGTPKGVEHMYEKAVGKAVIEAFNRVRDATREDQFDQMLNHLKEKHLPEGQTTKTWKQRYAYRYDILLFFVISHPLIDF